jgi:hypothetical protein
MATMVEPEAGFDPMSIPNLTEQGLFEYIRNELGVPVTRGKIKWAVIDREFVPTRIGRANLFSRRNALDWLREQADKPAPSTNRSTRKKSKPKNPVPKVVVAHDETFTHCVACSQPLKQGSPYALCKFCRDYEPPKNNGAVK